jgi:hypothetical protein
VTSNSRQTIMQKMVHCPMLKSTWMDCKDHILTRWQCLSSPVLSSERTTTHISPYEPPGPSHQDLDTALITWSADIDSHLLPWDIYGLCSSYRNSHRTPSPVYLPSAAHTDRKVLQDPVLPPPPAYTVVVKWPPGNTGS